MMYSQEAGSQFHSPLQTKNVCKGRKYCKGVMKAQAFIHTESEKCKKKKKKIVRISSSSFLGKEHEMDCARITRKNYRPHWGQWRRIYGKEAVGSSSERKTEMAGPRKIEAEGSKLWLKFLNCRSQENHIFVQIKTK